MMYNKPANTKGYFIDFSHHTKFLHITRGCRNGKFINHPGCLDEINKSQINLHNEIKKVLNEGTIKAQTKYN